MNCNIRYEYDEQVNKEQNPKTKAGMFERLGTVFFTFVIVSICAIKFAKLFPQEPRGDTPKQNWEQMSGNDGKFWRGTPDDSIYSSMEGVGLIRYYQYLYDSEGRLSKVNTFRHHDYYEDIWVLSDEETYEYDSQGRISGQFAVSGNTQWVYEYTEEGYTKTQSWAYGVNDLIYSYDLAGNQIYFRNASNYRYPHATTYEYDEKNRLVRKILEVEGKEPYGIPPHVTLFIEYDDENYTSVGTEYDSKGEATYVWLNTYDENWEKAESMWYDVDQVPKGYTPDFFADYYTRGYWVSYSDGLKMEEMSNEPWKSDRNFSEYTAYDYDGNGNCIIKLQVYRSGHAHMYRYVYDKRNRLVEQYSYDFSEVKFWERLLSDGSKLTLEVDDDETLSITRTALDGSVINQFIYGDDNNVEVQYKPAETVYWQLSPARFLAERQQDKESDQAGTGSAGSKPDDSRPNSGDTEPDRSDSNDKPSAQPESFIYTVEPGDCLWHIAERFLNSGQRFVEIYDQNGDVIGDDPGLILPGMRLYIKPE